MLELSRRELLQGTIMTVAGLACHRNRVWSQRSPKCLLISEDPECCLGESVEGYEIALQSFGAPFEKKAELWEISGLLIVPGVTSLEWRLARVVVGVAKAGGRVILECAFGFGPAENHARHHELFQTLFDIALERPLQVWSEIKSHRYDPYVDYVWPRSMRVRDFSSICPFESKQSEVIASLGSQVVGIRKSLGDGSIVLLGSPLGPALRAGDLQARAWFSDLLGMHDLFTVR